MSSFSNHLERWRQEPEVKRQRRAFLFAATLTLILFVLWLGSFRLAATLRSTPSQSAAVVPAVETDAGPSIVDRIKAGWRSVTQ